MYDPTTAKSAIRAWDGIAIAAVVLGLLGLGGDVWFARYWLLSPPLGAAAAAWLPVTTGLMATGLMTTGLLLVGAALALGLPVLGFVAARFARKAAKAHAALGIEIQRRLATEEALRQAQKLEAVGRLAGGIAHDFNNHLTAISSNVELLKRRLPNPTPALERFADAAMQGVQRAATLSQRLLAFSREQTPDPEPLDAGQLVGGMLDLLRRTLGERIEIDATSGNGLWLTRVDVNQLESALLALAVNARDAMPAGGRLHIQTVNVLLCDDDPACGADLAPGPYVMIAVSDSGVAASMGAASIGTASNALTPLLLAHPCGVDAGPGLSMVCGFARQCGGHVQVETIPGRGRTVRLYLPRYVVAGLQSCIADEAIHHAPGDTTTVLVVEDDDTVRCAAVEALREIGYDVLEAPDAMEAVRLLADRGGIDLLFTDVGLPGGVNGRVLADAARNIHPALKVLFTTGYTREAAQRGGLPRAEEHFLPKPFSLEQLAAKVRDVLGANVAADTVGAGTEATA